LHFAATHDGAFKIFDVSGTDGPFKMTTSSSTESQPSTLSHQAVGRHWDRLPVPGEDFLKRKSTKTNLSSAAPPSDIFSATEHFGVLMLLAVWDRQPIMATTLRSASPPESKVSPVLTSATKLHLAYKGCLEEPCFTKLGYLPYH